MISVIVPIYKVEKYLNQCIESLIHQTYKDLEIILVDDGSPDKCGEICDEYALNDTRIKVIHQKNSGVAAARNAGLRKATGEYIAFVDSDDWIKPEMFEVLKNYLELYEKDLAICGYECYNEEGVLDDKRSISTGEPELVSRKDIIMRGTDIAGSSNLTVWGRLFKAEIMQGLFFHEDLCYSDDIRFYFDYLLRINSAVYIHEAFYCFRQRAGSITHGGSKIKNIADSFKTHEYIYENVKQDPELKDHYQAYMLDNCLYRYRKAKISFTNMDEKEKNTAKSSICKMRNYIKKHALKAIFNKEIYWKTRIYYFLIN